MEDLRHSLAAKNIQLKAKNKEANAKLRQMVSDQQEAEAKQAASFEIQAALEKQDAYIRERQDIVQLDLAQAEPAVLEALAAVGNIKKQHLAEVRSMGSPPEAVKLAMESACSVLGHQVDSWKTVRSIFSRDDFISSIQNFDTQRMSKGLRERMMRDYISQPAFTFENVNRASRACGPLVQWVIAQVRFSEILDKIAPLRQEVASLEQQAQTTKHQAQVMVETIAELEDSIARYKDEYADLISETQAIKTEMERVQSKVTRSATLLESLSAEQSRWKTGSDRFEIEMGTIVGDIIICAAFLAYAGYFDQEYRSIMRAEWTAHLAAAGIEVKNDLALVEFLSATDDRLRWQNNALPADSLCIENAIMLEKYNRFPLIIDPTGQATTYLQNEFGNRKITVTSFMDEAFLKNLESAIRFGTPLLVQDVENLDPILNSVLNRELRRTGGRVLIRIGSQDIDFSPAFSLFLSTRDPSAEFSPDLCSRVTFVNFTMTRSSLQTQALDKVLKTERPDVDQRRSDLLKLQGEFRVRLHNLERSLLQALNDSTGSILEDEAVIATLEVLKKEAAEVTKKVVDTDSVIREVDKVTGEYLPLAQAFSGIYFALEQLATINHFYQFSLESFIELFDQILHRNSNLNGIVDHGKRRAVLYEDLFLTTFQRVSRSLLHADHIVLANTLVRIRHRSNSTLQDEMDCLIEMPGSVEQHTLHMSPEQRKMLETKSGVEAVTILQADIDAHRPVWEKFLNNAEAEKSTPFPWGPSNGEHRVLQ